MNLAFVPWFGSKSHTSLSKWDAGSKIAILMFLMGKLMINPGMKQGSYFRQSTVPVSLPKSMQSERRSVFDWMAQFLKELQTEWSHDTGRFHRINMSLGSPRFHRMRWKFQQHHWLIDIRSPNHRPLYDLPFHRMGRLSSNSSMGFFSSGPSEDSAAVRSTWRWRP